METDTSTTVVRRCSICGEEGHIKSNRLFHPLEETTIELVVEEIPTEEPILDTPILEIPTEEPILDIPIIEEIPTEEPILDTPILEIPTEEPILDIPIIEEIPIPTEEAIVRVETPVPPPIMVFNTLNFEKKNPTTYNQLRLRQK